MRNCKVFDGDSFAFFKEVRDKKQDDLLIARLKQIDKEIFDCFKWYDDNFNADTLETATARVCTNQEENDLGDLYRYESAVLSKLKIYLTTTPSGRLVKCQNCTINDVNTFDHLLPQSEFSEFTVHPKNLICSCGECNGRKGSTWRRNGARTSLNLYLDILPDEQYLYVTNDVGNLSVETNFYLQCPANMDPVLFAKIESHYTKLKLLRRFSDGADSVISSLKATIEPLRRRHTLQEVQEIVAEMLDKERIAFGYNFWQTILKYELIFNDDFMIDFQ
jgi:5-methylcytosine-specific restriction endonuclease McrA